MDELLQFLQSSLQRAVPRSVAVMADYIRNSQSGVVAMLAYGSALRDSSPVDTLIDFYVVVEEPQHLSSNVILQKLGVLMPPIVHYAETTLDGQKLRSKYAVITKASFQKLMTASNPYLWVRFSQPSRLVWSRDDEAKAKVLKAIATAVQTAFGHGKYLSDPNPWVHLFQNTYRTELRPEGNNRAASIVEADKEYYGALSEILRNEKAIASSWLSKRLLGKLWSLARLGKNAFTFAGGADYAAWKIERHSGVKIEVTDWQRRHPFLAGILILPRLMFRRGLR